MKCHFYVMEKFCDFFILRPSDLFIKLTYVLIDNFCSCFQNTQFRVLQNSAKVEIYLGKYLFVFTFSIYHKKKKKIETSKKPFCDLLTWSNSNTKMYCFESISTLAAF